MTQLFDPAVALLYSVCAVGMLALGMALLRRRQLSWNDSAFGTMAVAFPNTGYMGLPLLLNLLGPSAVGTAIVTILVDVFFTSSVCIAMSRMDHAQDHGVRTFVGSRLGGLLAHVVRQRSDSLTLAEVVRH